MIVKRVLKELSRRSLPKLSLTKVTVGSLAFQKSSTLLRLVNTTHNGESDSGFAFSIRIVVVSPASLRSGIVAKAHTAVGQTIIVASSSSSMLDTPLTPDKVI